MSSIKKISGVVLVGAVLALAGCGNDDSTTTGGLGGGTGGTSGGTTGGGTGSTTTGSSSSEARAIEVTFPRTDAIINEGDGVYSNKGSVVVTDNEGDPVSDGTKVYFNVVDSVFAMGLIGSGDSATGTTFTGTAPVMADGVNSTTFDQAYVYRNYAYRFIEPGDHLFMFDVDEKDKNRIISGSTGSITANTLTLTSAYANSYPNTVYPADNSSYMVGASTLGAEIIGKDGDNDVHGYSVTKNGVAKFKITYPADVNSILSGCLGSADERSLPKGSAQVYVIASAGENAVTVDGSACFKAISPYKLTAIQDKLGGNGGRADFTLVDGGDAVNLPFTQVSSSVVTTGAIVVSVDFYTLDVNGDEVLSGKDYGNTDRSGKVSANIKVTNAGASGNEATVVFYSPDPAGTKVTYTIKTP